jgi:hypothetical protein
MADEIYPGYDPKIDPWPVTCWGHPTAEQKEASAKRERESIRPCLLRECLSDKGMAYGDDD